MPLIKEFQVSEFEEFLFDQDFIFIQIIRFKNLKT